MLRELAVITLLTRPQKVITEKEIKVQYRLYFALGKAYVKKNAQLEKFIFPVRKIYFSSWKVPKTQLDGFWRLLREGNCLSAVPTWVSGYSGLTALISCYCLWMSNSSNGIECRFYLVTVSITHVCRFSFHIFHELFGDFIRIFIFAKKEKEYHR